MASADPVFNLNAASCSVERAPLRRLTASAARAFSLLLSLSVAMASLSAFAADRSATVTVFAAASMTDVLTRLGQAYETQGGKAVRFSFAASSTLARQLAAGAPAQLFVSADNEWMDYAASHGAIDVASRRVLIGNRLVLVAPRTSRQRLHIARGMNLVGALGARGRLAMADPESVPAGRYGRTALVNLGLWSQVADRLVRAENVRSALTFVARGEAPLAIVYRSDATVEPDVRIVDTFPTSTHAPIVYPIALTPSPSLEARAFYTYLLARAQQPTFLRYGFVRP